jgi:O-antigen/teichoic acid export membrane protein
VLLKNIFYNLGFQILPIIVALIFIPIDIEIMGNDVFGIYSLFITIIVIFNYINFGIAPSTTKEVSKYKALGNNNKISSIIINSFILMFFIGVSVGYVFYFFDINLAYLLSKKSTISISECKKIIDVFVLLSPLIMLFLFFRSLLEGIQNFLITALVRSITNSIIFVVPLLYPIMKLYEIFYILVVYYIIINIMLCIVVNKKFIIKISWFSIKDSQQLLYYGWWMMIISIAGVILYYIDRFVIAFILGSIYVTYYTVPFDLISRGNMITSNVVNVFYPYITELYSKKNYEIIKNQLFLLSKIIILVMSIFALVFIIFSKDFLIWWLNGKVNIDTIKVMQILSIGVMLNSIAYIPNKFLNAIHLSKQVSKIFFYEMFFYPFLLIILLKEYGLSGAASSYLIRALLEGILLSNILFKYLKVKIIIFDIVKYILFIVLSIVIIYNIELYFANNPFIFVLSVSIYAISYFSIVFSIDERDFIIDYFKKRYIK